ncbi:MULTISPECIES: alpha/beta fold hydrolase [Methylomonas]|uniref:Alpha/beta hydrolase n=2 Tax=Methylomonas TaxID=416 RepID=A0A126T2Q9_9GAMM|nr:MULTISPECIES: alpha/beta hydrolase [Methylomonas]AMK76352.1 alpha/beta hydrolase [Methylomonas denitrificans]OAI00530.1 alpha/beta hydrolase [Methylomonas methanica]TCV88377.1 pimeloyl-ACP methyl ester carboxylesterase [Methylomonas methanica]
MDKKLFYLSLTLLLTGCATLPNMSTEQIDNRQIEYALSRHGKDTVVFENGLGGKLNWWAEVFPEIAKDTTAFAYNRPGYGNSEPVATPRDGAHIVDELRELLRSKGLKPPYVLVGHSLGGLYIQHFARRYPDQVRALVLVDSTHPAQLKDKGSPENWPAWLRLFFKIATSDVEKQEFSAIDATGETIMGLPTFSGKPVLVLSASESLEEESELAVDANEKRKDLARLYPGSKLIWADSGHGIPLEQPEAVIAAIREAMTSE